MLRDVEVTVTEYGMMMMICVRDKFPDSLEIIHHST